jgi:hypothetical protein
MPESKWEKVYIVSNSVSVKGQTRSDAGVFSMMFGGKLRVGKTLPNALRYSGLRNFGTRMSGCSQQKHLPTPVQPQFQAESF